MYYNDRQQQRDTGTDMDYNHKMTYKWGQVTQQTMLRMFQQQRVKMEMRITRDGKGTVYFPTRGDEAFSGEESQPPSLTSPTSNHSWSLKSPFFQVLLFRIFRAIAFARSKFPSPLLFVIFFLRVMF